MKTGTGNKVPVATEIPWLENGQTMKTGNGLNCCIEVLHANIRDANPLL